jgi:AraC-like DNA-binding protein
MVNAALTLGVEVNEILEAEGVSWGTLNDPDARIPHPTVVRIWDRLARDSGEPGLPLRAPSLLPHGAYRVLDYLAVATPTLGQWIELFARHFRLVNNGVDLQVKEADGRHYLEMRMSHGGAVEPLYVDYTFAAILERTRLRAHPDWNPAFVELRRAAPSDTEPYDSVFRSPVAFHAKSDRLWCSPEDWKAHSGEADVPLSLLLEDHARLLGDAIPTQVSFVATVRRSITAFLQSGAPAEQVAKQLGVSMRTLQRHLTDRGTTYSAVLDGVREDLARSYLGTSDVAICEVAFLLGFSEQRSFHPRLQAMDRCGSRGMETGSRSPLIPIQPSRAVVAENGIEFSLREWIPGYRFECFKGRLLRSDVQVVRAEEQPVDAPFAKPPHHEFTLR